MMNLASGSWPFFGLNPWADLLAPSAAPQNTGADQGRFVSGVFRSTSRAIDNKL